MLFLTLTQNLSEHIYHKNEHLFVNFSDVPQVLLKNFLINFPFPDKSQTI